MKNIISAVAAVAATTLAPAFAATPDTNTWLRTAAERSSDNQSWSRGVGFANGTSNGYGILYSNNSLSGDVEFTGTMTSTGFDNDIMGIVFGFQDNNNYYRMGWEDGGFADASGERDFWLVKEVAGVRTTLFTSGDEWIERRPYDFRIARNGGNLEFSIFDTVSMSTIISQTVADMSFMTGAFGVYTESQAASFTNLETNALGAAPVPVPAALPLMAGGLAGIGALRRRKKS
ncbi:MAG: VPLPA-CTERM sorting domain-containing protein [Parvularculaceae bacterium]|nr:VPLPA-CTERM sorting domain-containing protein [Parvularculaceae bacterium]